MAQKLYKLALLLCGATIFCSVAGDTVTYSIPAFNAATRDDYYVGLTDSIGLSYTTIFSPTGDGDMASTNSTGFVLLSNNIEFWRPSGIEASFSTSFTLAAGAAPVSFVVRGSSTNIIMAPRGPSPANATASLAFVEVGGLRTGCSCLPSYGLNVTVSPAGEAPGGRAVWVDYRAAEHSLYVYVGRAGEPRPPNHHLNVSMPHGVYGNWTTERAPVGFFATVVRDVITGVRDWNFTVEVDKQPE